MTAALRAPLLDLADDLDEDERVELDAILDESLAEARAGQEVSNEEAFRAMASARHAALTAR